MTQQAMERTMLDYSTVLVFFVGLILSEKLLSLLSSVVSEYHSSGPLVVSLGKPLV